MKSEMQSFQCSCCGVTLPGPVLSWAFEAPDLWVRLAQDEKDRSELKSDVCIINDEFFFINGNIEVSVHGGEGFSWSVWVSLSRPNFLHAGKMWDDPQRIDEPPYFGWLCNSIPGYPETLNLKTMVHTRKIGMRPFIELEATDHPLSMEQRNGITSARVREIAETMHHHNQRVDGPDRSSTGMTNE